VATTYGGRFLFIALMSRHICWKDVISAYDVWRISAHRFAISVPNLVWNLGLILGPLLSYQCFMMLSASLIVAYDGTLLSSLFALLTSSRNHVFNKALRLQN